MSAHRPLDGVKVIEVGQLLAGPFTGTFLGYFGAEVIKVEPPGKGDPIREWRLLDDNGTSFGGNLSVEIKSLLPQIFEA